MSNKIIYYNDELNDEFSSHKINPIKIDEHYKYKHNFLWNLCSFVVQNIISMPIKYFYAKIKFNHKIVGKEKFKISKENGYFIYVNHTQEFCDTFLPSIANYPKRNFFIVNPENVSMKGLKHLVELLGAIPVPGNIKGTKNFKDIISNHIKNKHSITIYPEAHIWPYYTKIRPFKDVSFKYPVELNVPIYTITNTYQLYKKNKVQITSYIDGPFYPKQNTQKKQAQKDLRDIAYNTMCERAKNSSYEHIRYERSSITN